MGDGSKDIVVAEGAIYLRQPDQARVAAIVAALQRPEVGAIFTRPGQDRTAAAGVVQALSFDVARWNHP
jgi:hypothetical protein